jgi:hypothetical protein
MAEEFTTASLRDLVVELSRELRAEAFTSGAETLAAAAAEPVAPPEDLLVLREALVRTRPDWERLGAGWRRRTARALNAAKKLAAGM